MNKSYVKHLYNMEEQSSGLLGFFDSNNEYRFDDKIISELINCNKIILDYSKDIIVAEAKFNDFKLDFKIFIQDGEGNKKRAGLFLIEKCQLKIDKKELQTYIDSFVYENSPLFYEQLKSKYHLYTKDESEGIDISNSNFSNIINKKSESKKYKVMIPVLMNADKEYVKRVLAIIKASGSYGDQFILMLKNAAENNKLNQHAPNYWRDLRLLLDKMIKDNSALFDKQTLAKMEEVQKAYVDVYSKTKLDEKTTQSPKASKSKGKDGGKFSFEGIKALGLEGGNGGGGGKNEKKSDKDKDQNSKPEASSKSNPKNNETKNSNATKSNSNKHDVKITNTTKEKETHYSVKQTITTTDGHKITREYEIFGLTLENTISKTIVPPKVKEDMGREG